MEMATSYGKFFKDGKYGQHETFHLRTGWLRKAYDKVDKKPDGFSKENVNEDFGVGKNMVNAIKYWAVAFGIIEKKTSSKPTEYKKTELAEFLFEKDRYLEDPASDWLLHYNLVTTPQNAPVLFWAFNIMNFNEFNKRSFLSGLKAFLTNIESMRDISEKTLTSEYSTFIRTYYERNNESKQIKRDIFDCPFSSLQIISAGVDRSTFKFKIGKKKNLPSQLVAYSIFKMAKNGNSNQKIETFTIEFDKLLWGAYSPGMCFKLDGEALLDYIDDICNNNYLGNASYSTTAGIKRLTVNNKRVMNHLEILEKYFKDETK